MSNFRSPGKFCSLTATNLTASSDSIAAFNGALLGEGAEAYCTSNQKVYRFTSATLTAFNPTIVAANTGGGSWVMQGPEAFQSVSAVGSAAFTSGGSVAATPSVWTEQKTGAGFFTTQPGFGSDAVTVNSTTGLILFDPSLAARFVAFLVTGTFSVSCTVAGQVWEFDLTQASGGNVGTTNQSQTAVQATVNGAITGVVVTHTRLFIPTPGLGYEHVFRCVSGVSPSLYTGFYQVSVVPVGTF